MYIRGVGFVPKVTHQQFENFIHTMKNRAINAYEKYLNNGYFYRSSSNYVNGEKIKKITHLDLMTFIKRKLVEICLTNDIIIPVPRINYVIRSSVDYSNPIKI